MDYEFANGLQGFQNVWMRVVGENPAVSAQPPGEAQELEAFIRGENEDIAFYGALARRCNSRYREKLLRIQSDERRHMKELQLEHYLMTGDSYPAQPATSAPQEGILSALREAYISECRGAAAYASAAQRTQDSKLKELYSNNSRDEESHAKTLRDLIERALG